MFICLLKAYSPEDKNEHSNKGADWKMESNDSPEIPDKEEASEGPSLPSCQKTMKISINKQSLRQLDIQSRR